MDNLKDFNQLLQQAPDHDDNTYPFWLAQQFFSNTDSTPVSTTDTIAASTPLTDTTTDTTTAVSTPLTATTAVSTPLTATIDVSTPLTATSQTGVNSKRKRKAPLKGEPSAKLKAHIKHCAEEEEHLQEEKLEEKKREAKEETTVITIIKFTRRY